MERSTIIKLTKNFEEFAYEEEGVEFWFARDLQKLLGYSKWENFVKVLEKVKGSAGNKLSTNCVELKLKSTENNQIKYAK